MRRILAGGNNLQGAEYHPAHQDWLNRYVPVWSFVIYFGNYFSHLLQIPLLEKDLHFPSNDLQRGPLEEKEAILDGHLANQLDLCTWRGLRTEGRRRKQV